MDDKPDSFQTVSGQTEYEKLVENIKKAPDTWLPALLILIVRVCHERVIFKAGGLQRTIERAITGR